MAGRKMKSKSCSENTNNLDLGIAPTFECIHCNKSFKREDSFLKHECEQKKRAEAFRTEVVVKAAFAFYKKWMAMQRRPVTSAEAFLTSKTYHAFVKFAKFAKSVKIVDVDMYISMMVSKKIQPSFWTENQCFSNYLSYIDHKRTPIDHARITIDTLNDIAEAGGCDISEVFTILTPHETMFLIQQRKLSPWILLRSKKFKACIMMLDEDEQAAFEQLVPPTTWIKKFATQEKMAALMKKIVLELGL